MRVKACTKSGLLRKRVEEARRAHRHAAGGRLFVAAHIVDFRFGHAGPARRLGLRTGRFLWLFSESGCHI
jgi:hypothetical protein